MDKEIKTLKPFKYLCMTIGNLPTSYIESMSYYETLCWLCKYLENTVTPAVNNNAEALQELQDYVSNYFENLDVQEEINNKLDEMAESGELANIINVEMIGTLSNLTTTDKTNLVSAINEVNVSANALNINQFQYFTADNITGTTGCTVGNGVITVCTNSEGTVAKIYSDIDIVSTLDSGTAKITISTNLAPSSSFTIKPAGIVMQKGVEGAFIDKLTLNIGSDGTVEILIPINGTDGYYNVSLYPCIYLIKDFGDVA